MKLTHLLAPLLLATAAAFAQGPLAPSGAPAPTMKSLDQIFTEASAASAKAEKRTPISSLPFTITQPGSYYLTGNLTMTTAGAGITNIASSDSVTLDLNGFTLDGNNVGGTGIFNNSNFKVVVLNGAVTRWGEYAVFAYGYTALSDLVLDSTYGVALPDAVLRRCTITQRQGSGVYALSGNTMDVRECSIRTMAAGTLGGVYINTGAIANCAITGTLTGDTGMSAGLTMGSGSATDVQISAFDTGVRAYSAFTGRGLKISSARKGMNFGQLPGGGHSPGFKVSDSSTSVDGLGGSTEGISVVAAGYGFDFTNIRVDGYPTGMAITPGGGQIRDCTVSHCGHGIRVLGAGAIVSGCTVSDPEVPYLGYGINVGNNSIVRNSTISVSGSPTSGFLDGITAGSGTEINGCVISGQILRSITVAPGCVVRGNTCNDASQYGIVASGERSLIEGNHIKFNASPSGAGIYVVSPNNIVIRNSIQGVASLIQGASGPGIAPLQNPATSTNPNANLSY